MNEQPTGANDPAELTPLPCPHCGGTEFDYDTDEGPILDDGHIEEGGFIGCTACCMRGPYAWIPESGEDWQETHRRAVELWNGLSRSGADPNRVVMLTTEEARMLAWEVEHAHLKEPELAALVERLRALPE